MKRSSRPLFFRCGNTLGTLSCEGLTGFAPGLGPVLSVKCAMGCGIATAPLRSDESSRRCSTCVSSSSETVFCFMRSCGEKGNAVFAWMLSSVLSRIGTGVRSRDTMGFWRISVPFVHLSLLADCHILSFGVGSRHKAPPVGGDVSPTGTTGRCWSCSVYRAGRPLKHHSSRAPRHPR